MGLLNRKEDLQLERKASFLAPIDPTRPRTTAQMTLEVGKSIAALANAEGGFVIVGQQETNRDRGVIGLENDYKARRPMDRDGFQQRLTSYVREHLKPGWAVLGLRNHWLAIEGEDVLIIEVPAHHQEPVELRDADKRACIYVRGEGSSLLLEGAELGRWVRKRFPHS